MRKFIIAALATVLLCGAASLSDYTTTPPGTVVGNPSLWAVMPTPLPAASYGAALLAVLKSANMNVTTDQAMSMMALPAKYLVTSVYATNCSAPPTGAAGGIYTATGKGGTAIVAGTQTYTGLATATAVAALTNNVASTSLTATQYYLTLTTALGSAATCDIYVYGMGFQ